MVDRLNEPESRFHASLVSNVLDLVNLLPQLNVGEDPELNRFAGEIRTKLCGFTSRDLKTNDVLRVATANDAAALLYEMDAVLRDRICQRTWRLPRNAPHRNSNRKMAVF